MNVNLVALASFLPAAIIASLLWLLVNPRLDEIRARSPAYLLMLSFFVAAASLLGVGLPLMYFGIAGAPTAIAGGILSLEFGVVYARRTVNQNRGIHRRASRGLARFWWTKH